MTRLVDKQAEEAVISSCILDPESFEVARDIVKPSDFGLDAHRVVFEALCELEAKGSAFDVVTVAGHLRSAGMLDRVGGSPELARLVDATPAVAHVDDHAQTVANLGRQRRVLQAAKNIIAKGSGWTSSIDELCNWAEAEMGHATQKDALAEAPADLGTVAGEVVTEILNRGSGVMGARSGLTTLDDRICGWLPLMYVIAGRPGMGKSAFALAVALGIAKNSEKKKLSVVVSLEMPKEQIAMRALAAEARVSIQDLRAGRVKGHAKELTAAAANLGEIPISIKFRPGASVADVRSIVRRAHRDARKKYGDDIEIGCIAVDYMQLMSGQGQSREQEVAGISRDLLGLAGEFNAPVLALSQLNRGVETRGIKDKRPQLSDLRESGAIEQDADTIMFLYRDEYYFDDSPDQGQAEAIVAKQRNGPTGTVKLKFAAHYTRFSDLSNVPPQLLDDMAEPMNPPPQHWQDQL